MDSVSSHAAPSYHAQSEAKRRKVRKGTHSCWECKRRKMKCIFDPLTNAACNGCRRRGSQCVSQEFPEEVSLSVDETRKMSDGHPWGNGTPTPSEGGKRADHSIPTPLSMSSEPSQYLAFFKSFKHHTLGNHNLQSTTNAPASQGKYEKLSHFLHESLPSREDTEKICEASRQHSVLGHELLTIPYTTLDQNGLKTPESLLEIPEPHLHPVLISRHMLQLATFLRHLHPDFHKEIKGLSESPRAIMERLTDLAISLVTTNDELLGSIEGLECVMIESVYQGNIGNLRRSWVANRRAMSIAQLMGLNRSDNQAQYKVLDPKTKYHPQLMWFRIIMLDRHLCLMLGLPQGCLDRSMASDAMLANDTPMGRLERIHCVLASRILERNESNPSSHDHNLTRTLDVELQRASRSLPSKWWLTPNLDIASVDSQALFWDTRRLFTQVFHYNLLNQLHLPYMLRSSSGERKYEYSRITCVNASREVLSRFITLRTFNRVAFSCRTIDFLALMAAMTLLLAHLDSHASGAENLLAHQYLSDRAMIERVQENMEEVNRLNSDALSAQSADLLRQLLAIEVETVSGYPLGARKVSVQEAGTETALSDKDDDTAVSVRVPYFGIIKISREGMNKVVPEPQPPSTLNQLNRVPHIELKTPVNAGYGHTETPSTLPQEALDIYTKAQAHLGMLSIPAISANNIDAHFAPQLQNGLSDTLLQHREHPGLVAGGEDWAFQGVDMAFFESLMRSAGNGEDEDAEWTTIA